MVPKGSKKGIILEVSKSFRFTLVVRGALAGNSWERVKGYLERLLGAVLGRPLAPNKSTKIAQSERQNIFFSRHPLEPDLLRIFMGFDCQHGPMLLPKME